MSDPYRTAAVSAVVPMMTRDEMRGSIMSRWTLGRITLDWNHAEECAELRILDQQGGIAGRTPLELDDVRELAAMAQRAADEMVRR